MAKSSFHAEKPTEHARDHMNRKSKVTYLIDPASDHNEYWENKKIPSQKKFVELAKPSYTKRVNQKMQKTQFNALIKEAVINLNEYHTLKDVKRVMFIAGKVLGGYVPFQICVHKDEGVFVEYVGKLKDEWNPADYEYNSKNFKWYKKKKNGERGKEVTNIISFRPARDYHYNNIDQKWYIDKEFTKKANLSNMHTYYNYHAHVLYSSFDLNTGKGRNNRKEMRSLQTLVANELEMERGEIFSNTRRQTHWERKAESDLLNDEKREHQKTKQKSKELVYENSINKNQVWYKERIIKNMRIGIETYETLKTEQKQLQELLNCGDDMNIEEGIQQIKEESRKIIEALKAEIEEKRKSIENQSIVYESKITELDKEVAELTEDVYSESPNIKYKNLVSGMKDRIENLENDVKIFKKQLEPTGYEVEGASVTKVAYDYIEAMKEKYNKKIEILIGMSYTGHKTIQDPAIDETWKDRARKEEDKVLDLEMKIDKQNEEKKEVKKEFEKTVKELEKEKLLLSEDLERLDKLAFYEKDVYIDKLDDHIAEKFSYKSENEDLQKKLKTKESELELANKVLKTVYEYKVPSENLSGDIRVIAEKVLEKKWLKRIDEVKDLSLISELEDEQIENQNDTEFIKP